MTSLELANKMAELLNEKKATDITILEIGNLSTLGDYFVIASGTSTTQVKALADELDDKISKLGCPPRRMEGYQAAQWILLDFSDVIVHLFCAENREFYSLERLWSDAPVIYSAKS